MLSDELLRKYIQYHNVKNKKNHESFALDLVILIYDCIKRSVKWSLIVRLIAKLFQYLFSVHVVRKDKI